MMYSRDQWQDQPNIFINDCLVHNRVSYPDLEAAERERMWEAREARAAERERSASLPSGDISVRSMSWKYSSHLPHFSHCRSSRSSSSTRR